jgi:hypothetical protein
VAYHAPSHEVASARLEVVQRPASDPLDRYDGAPQLPQPSAGGGDPFVVAPDSQVRHKLDRVFVEVEPQRSRVPRASLGWTVWNPPHG